MQRLRGLGKRRFIGNSETKEVHDRWHEDCEDCLLEDLVDKGVAVGFNPDTLDGALYQDFEPCPHCFGRTDPPKPKWAD
jgi:hypothetical protein